MDELAAQDVWHIDPVTATVSSHAALVDPVVVVVETHPALCLSIAAVCDFLGIRVERLPEGAGIVQRLRDLRPIAMLGEAAGVDCRVYDLLMSVAGYDPDLPLLVVMPDDAPRRGALDGARNLWQLTDVVHSARRPGIRELIEFLFRAGRRAGREDEKWEGGEWEDGEREGGEREDGESPLA